MAALPGFVPLGRLPQKGEAVWVDNGGWSSGIAVHTPREGKVIINTQHGVSGVGDVTHDLSTAVFYKPSP